MRNLFQHNKAEDKEFGNIYSELSDISETTSRISNIGVWHKGEGEPEKALGKDKDFYLDTTTGDIYNKENGEWI